MCIYSIVFAQWQIETICMRVPELSRQAALQGCSLNTQYPESRAHCLYQCLAPLVNAHPCCGCHAIWHSLLRNLGWDCEAQAYPTMRQLYILGAIALALRRYRGSCIGRPVVSLCGSSPIAPFFVRDSGAAINRCGSQSGAYRCIFFVGCAKSLVWR